jgi:glycosyltransferase involved in cell wall biosynthesis
MVLSLKQGNIVGRAATILMPRLTRVAFEHIAEYRARRFQGLYGPLLQLLSRRVGEIWADCEETLEETRHHFVLRHRARHVISLFVAESDEPLKTDYAMGSCLRLAGAGRLIARKNVPLMVAAVDALRREGVDTRLDLYDLD